MTAQRWSILTGEYPAQKGGVADYTHLVAEALAAAGDDVEVWAPSDGSAAPAPRGGGVAVHRLPDHFGPRGLRRLSSRLDPGRRLLVQYVPHAFGYRAMNVPFCLWAAGRGRRQAVWAMFHEVAYPWGRQPIKHNVLAGVTRAMAGLIVRAASRVFISIPAWERLLRPLAGPRKRFEWLPVPSNLPSGACPEAVAAVRQARGIGASPLIGHFGTFSGSGAIAAVLRDALPAVLAARPGAVAMLLGRRCGPFADALLAAHPALAGRLHLAEDLPPDALAAHLKACDLMLQPYPDGATTRRGSLMGPLALGVPIVTTDGPLSEPTWSESGGVALAAAGDTAALVGRAVELLNEPARRVEVGARGRAVYDSRFALEHTIRALRGEPAR